MRTLIDDEEVHSLRCNQEACQGSEDGALSNFKDDTVEIEATVPAEARTRMKKLLKAMSTA